MSAGQTTQQDRYRVVRIITRSPFKFTLIDYEPEFSVRVDEFSNAGAAYYAAHLLNRGVARVDSHAIVGCKVVAS